MTPLETLKRAEETRSTLERVSTFLAALGAGDLARAAQCAPGLVWFGKAVDKESFANEAAMRFFSPGALVAGKPRTLPDVRHALSPEALEAAFGVALEADDLVVLVDCSYHGRIVTLGLVVGHTVRAAFDPTALAARLQRRA